MFRLKVRYEELKLYGAQFLEDCKWDEVRVAAEIIRDVKEYPPVPPRPPNRYQRTGNLGRGWTSDWPRRRGHIIYCEITNNMWYAPLVQGEQQWELHARHGWKNILDVTQKYENDFRDRIYHSLGKHHWEI